MIHVEPTAASSLVSVRLHQEPVTNSPLGVTGAASRIILLIFENDKSLDMLGWRCRGRDTNVFNVDLFDLCISGSSHDDFDTTYSKLVYFPMQ